MRDRKFCGRGPPVPPEACVCCAPRPRVAQQGVVAQIHLPTEVGRGAPIGVMFRNTSAPALLAQGGVASWSRFLPGFILSNRTVAAATTDSSRYVFTRQRRIPNRPIRKRCTGALRASSKWCPDSAGLRRSVPATVARPRFGRCRRRTPAYSHAGRARRQRGRPCLDLVAEQCDRVGRSGDPAA